MGDHWTERLQQISTGLAGSLGLGLGGAIAAVVVVNPAVSAAVLTGWSFEPTRQALSIVLPPGVTPRFLVFAEPARIVLEVPGTQLGPITTLASYAGPVRQVQVIQQSADVVHIVLELAPNTVIDRRHAELTSSAADGQTRWTLTPLIVDGPALPIASAPEPAPAAPAESTAEIPAAVDLPVPAPAAPAESVAVAPAESAAEAPAVVDLPAPAPELPAPAAGAPEAPTRPLAQPPVGPRFIDGPEGQLSIRASNLMLPLPGDRLADLPNTLPLDPFATSFAPATQVSVPPLDSAVAITPNPPQVSVPAPAPDPGASAAAEIAVAPPGQQLPAAPSQPAQPSLATPTPAPSLPASAPLTPDSLAAQPSIAQPSTAQLSIEMAPPDQSPVASTPVTPASSSTAIAVPPPATATVESLPFLPSPAQPTGAQPLAAAPPTAAVPSLAPSSQSVPVSAEPVGAVTVAPPAGTLPAGTLPAATAPAATALTVSPPPFLAAPAIAPAAAAPAADPLPPVLLTPPPTAPEPVPFVVSPSSAPALTSPPPDAVIAFGQPLPAAAAKEDLPSFPYLAAPASHQPPIGADVLIPAGTLLPLRYDGSEPLQLDQQGRVTVPLQLEHELRDAKTGAVIAPAGSQVIGEFGPDEMGLRWVSQTLVLPGREVPLESASAYLSGPPQVAGQSLAVNSGIGALALTVLTGFSGVGLVGGALLGATAAVGMAPQTIVIEPHQVIQVQVLTDVPRSALRLQ